MAKVSRYIETNDRLNFKYPDSLSLSVRLRAQFHQSFPQKSRAHFNILYGLLGQRIIVIIRAQCCGYTLNLFILSKIDLRLFAYIYSQESLKNCGSLIRFCFFFFCTTVNKN